MTRLKYIMVGIAMLIAAGLASVLKFPEKPMSTIAKIDLETMIPNQFGDWKVDLMSQIVQPAPEVQKSLKEIYSQTLSRTYINSTGYKVMLSIAYGSGFDKQLDVHRPEYCYRSQGFQVDDYEDHVFMSEFGKIPLRRMVATQGRRIEPISYWITIGNSTVSSTLQRKLLKIKRMLSGQQDSGMLVRISSIDSDKVSGYDKQAIFINELVKNIEISNRKLLINFD